MSYRDNVIKEALEQKRLRAEGKPIPASAKVYARKSGLITFLIGLIGMVIFSFISGMGSSIYLAAILFSLVITLLGLAQLITGKHLLTKR